METTEISHISPTITNLQPPSLSVLTFSCWFVFFFFFPPVRKLRLAEAPTIGQQGVALESGLGSTECESQCFSTSPACIAGDLGSIPGLGRSPGEGKGYLLQYSGLENSMDCTVHVSQKVGHDRTTFTFTSYFHSPAVFPTELTCQICGEPASEDPGAFNSEPLHYSEPHYYCIGWIKKQPRQMEANRLQNDNCLMTVYMKWLFSRHLNAFADFPYSFQRSPGYQLIEEVNHEKCWVPVKVIPLGAEKACWNTRKGNHLQHTNSWAQMTSLAKIKGNELIRYAQKPFLFACLESYNLLSS